LSPNEALKNVFAEIEESILTNGKFDQKGVRFPLASSPRVKLARIYIHLLTEVDEIIENLNFAMLGISELPKLKSLSRGQKMKRLHLLRRIYVYDFARVEDVLGQFLSGLGSLGYMSRRGIREIRNLFYRGTKPMIRARNYLIHNLAEQDPYEAKMEMITSFEHLGHKRAYKNKKLVILFDKWFTKHVRKDIIGMRVVGKRVASLIQDIADTFEPPSTP